MSNIDIGPVVTDILNLKTGWKTSEFWVALAPVVVGILSVFGVGVSDSATTHFIVVAWGAVSAIYVAARTLLKGVHLHHVTSLEALLQQVGAAGTTVLHTLEGEKVSGVSSATH